MKRARPRVPGTHRPPAAPPICASCFKTFEKAFSRVNDKQPPELRVGDGELRRRAGKRAQAVRFGGEWYCPRCTTVTDPLGKEIMLSTAYPNRQARRDGAKLARRAETLKRQRARGKGRT